MHEWGDSGISAILLAIIVAVLVSFGVVQQARGRAARYQEIRRLQFLTAEEARREEAEADAEYTSMVATRNCCVVCLNPTTTRCSRCKAVRYCSLACQAQHWKQGHKQDCRAPDAPSPGSSSDGSRHFSDVFSSSGSSRSGSRTVSEVSDLQSMEDAAPAAFPRTPSTWSANGTLSRPKKILFPYHEFVKFFYWERLKVPPCGLINCGNSCFANVVLQCLTYTRPLTAYLLEGSHGEECRRSDWCFMCELQDHVLRVRQSQNPFSPIRILSRIRNIGNHLGYGRQEDAHEFMRFAIDSMQSICLDEAGGEKSVDPRTQETTFIHHIFGGHLQSQVKCMQCLHESNRYENMMDLAVEIHGCVETLEDALTQFTAPEWLDGENKYKCDRCNAYVKARKRLTVHEAPNILTIALKRFQSGRFGKLNKRVTFPEVLDISPYMSGKGDRPPVYRLYAVVVHVDMLNASFFGHYICYVKDSHGLWYKIDDSKVKEVDLEKVMAQRAYMLFYTRSSVRPPPDTEEPGPPHPVAGSDELGRVGSKEQGGLKVFPGPLQLETDEVPAGGGSLGLHAMVHFGQMPTNVDRNREADADLSYTNGIGTLRSTEWEMDRIPSSSSQDEISADESGCVASSSSLTSVSPYISSYRSDQALWFPTEGLVRHIPDPSTLEQTEYVAWDSKSSLPCDFSEVSIQGCAIDKPYTVKVGKRRLEDDLSPLPTPKPLDTDQLPAWPAGNHGKKSLSCPPLVQTSCFTSNEDKSRESLPSAALTLQQRIPGDQLSLPVREDPGEEAERSLQVENTGAGQEEVIARAKRQHVEIDCSTDPGVRVRRLHQKSTAMPDRVSESGERHMDWDEPIREPESLDPILGSVLDPSVEGLSADPNKCSLLNVVQTLPCTEEHELLEQQVTMQSLVPNESNQVQLMVATPASPGRGVPGVNVLEQSSFEESTTTGGLSATSGLVLPCGREVATSSSCEVRLENTCSEIEQDPDGEPHAGLAETLGSSGLLQSMSPALDMLPRRDYGMSACKSEVVGDEGLPSSVESAKFGENVPESDLVNHKLDKIACNESHYDAAKMALMSDTVGTVLSQNGPSPSLQIQSGLLKANKPQNISRPLFKRGFLNRGCGLVPDTKAKSGKSVTSGRVHPKEEHTDEVEGQAHIDVTNPFGMDQQCVVQGGSDVAVHLQPSVAGNFIRSSCGNCTKCESCSSVHLSSADGIDNGHETVDCLIPHLHDHTGKTGGRIVDKCWSKGAETRRHIVNVVDPPLRTPAVHVDQERATEPAHETLTNLGQTSQGKLTSGKQKQGRNETCNCGSQRKWKKCCGKSGTIDPEPGRRRLVI